MKIQASKYNINATKVTTIKTNCLNEIIKDFFSVLPVLAPHGKELPEQVRINK